MWRLRQNMKSRKREIRKRFFNKFVDKEEFFGKMHFRSKSDRFLLLFFSRRSFFLKFWTRFLLEFALSPGRGHVLLHSPC